MSKYVIQQDEHADSGFLEPCEGMYEIRDTDTGEAVDCCLSIERAEELTERWNETEF